MAKTKKRTVIENRKLTRRKSVKNKTVEKSQKLNNKILRKKKGGRPYIDDNTYDLGYIDIEYDGYDEYVDTKIRFSNSLLAGIILVTGGIFIVTASAIVTTL